jgi:hypothetical protein
MEEAERREWDGKIVYYYGNCTVGPGSEAEPLIPECKAPVTRRIEKGAAGRYRWEYVEAEGAPPGWKLVGPLKRHGSPKHYTQRGSHLFLNNGYTTENHFYAKQCAGCRFGERLGGCANLATDEDGADLERASAGLCTHFSPGRPGSHAEPSRPVEVSAKADAGELAQWRAFAADVARAVYPGGRGEDVAHRLSVHDLLDLRRVLRAALGLDAESPAAPPSPPPPVEPINGELLVTPCPTHLAVEVNLLTGAQSCPHCGSR